MAEKAKTLTEAMEKLDLPAMETGRTTAIYMEEPNKMQKVTLTVKKQPRERLDVEGKWDRGHKHVQNIAIGLLEFAQTKEEVAEVKAKVDGMYAHMTASIDARLAKLEEK